MQYYNKFPSKPTPQLTFFNQGGGVFNILQHNKSKIVASATPHPTIYNGGPPVRCEGAYPRSGKRAIRPQRGRDYVNRLPSIARLSVGEHMRKRANGPPPMYFCQVGVCLFTWHVNISCGPSGHAFLLHLLPPAKAWRLTSVQPLAGLDTTPNGNSPCCLYYPCAAVRQRTPEKRCEGALPRSGKW